MKYKIQKSLVINILTHNDQNDIIVDDGMLLVECDNVYLLHGSNKIKTNNTLNFVENAINNGYIIQLGELT